MAPDRSSPRAVVVLLACILGVLLVLLTGGGVGVWLLLREEEFKRDKERYERLDRAIAVEIRIHDDEYQQRANEFITEQNAIIRKWPGRFPGRAEQQLLGSPDPRR